MGHVLYLCYATAHDISGNVTLSAWGKHGVVPYFADTLNLCDSSVISCPLKAGRGNAVFKYQLSQFQSIVSFNAVCVTVHSTLIVFLVCL